MLTEKVKRQGHGVISWHFCQLTRHSSILALMAKSEGLQWSIVLHMCENLCICPANRSRLLYQLNWYISGMAKDVFLRSHIHVHFWCSSKTSFLRRLKVVVNVPLYYCSTEMAAIIPWWAILPDIKMKSLYFNGRVVDFRSAIKIQPWIWKDNFFQGLVTEPRGF